MHRAGSARAPAPAVGRRSPCRSTVADDWPATVRQPAATGTAGAGGWTTGVDDYSRARRGGHMRSGVAMDRAPVAVPAVAVGVARRVGVGPAGSGRCDAHLDHPVPDLDRLCQLGRGDRCEAGPGRVYLTNANTAATAAAADARPPPPPSRSASPWLWRESARRGADALRVSRLNAASGVTAPTGALAGGPGPSRVAGAVPVTPRGWMWRRGRCGWRAGRRRSAPRRSPCSSSMIPSVERTVASLWRWAR